MSLVSGQFWGYTIPLLWGRAWRYFVAALLFDLLGGFVRENVEVGVGAYRDTYTRCMLYVIYTHTYQWKRLVAAFLCDLLVR